MNHKPFSFWDFDGKTGAPALYYIQRELCVLPIFKLIFTHPERNAINISQTHIATTNPEIALLKAHGRRAIATATTLMKE